VNYADIVWADLPDRGGREQRGRRPVVIWQDTAHFRLPTALIIPLTSQLNTLNFAGTALIRPTPANGLTIDSVALVFQLGACDVRRLGGQLGHLDDPDLAQLQVLARQLQLLP
jgi:mRNA-degrading endonuclease toxin of MazEF toxin-antitoxin module